MSVVRPDDKMRNPTLQKQQADKQIVPDLDELQHGDRDECP